MRLENPAGVTGVWAEENTRASIWDAMQRKETFGTSGPHMKVRFFGGWEYGADAIGKPGWVKTGYAKGVPMGADLPPPKAKAPTFLVWAVKDPTSGNLDRIQVIKGWTKSGQSFEKIFDVVWAGKRKPDKWTGKVPSIGSTVDIDNATYTNTIGAVELKTVWTDPEFDPSLHAFYYARVLEIPTPRWTTIQAHQLGIAPPDVVAATVQERAWSSPVWYTPSAEARKSAPPGLTVAELRKKGAVALTDAQLKTLLVGKSVWWRNTVTGEPFKVRYDADGRSVVLHVGKGVAIAERAGRRGAARLSGRALAVRDQERQARDLARQHAVRAQRLQAGRLVLRRPQQRVRLRELPDAAEGTANWSISAKGNRKNHRRPDTRIDRRRAGCVSRWSTFSRWASCSSSSTARSGARRRGSTSPPGSRSRSTICDSSKSVSRRSGSGRPTPEEMTGLLENRVREEILYREAIALGLDKEDSIVKRRMAQKMEFLAEDVSGAHEPDDRRARGLVREEREALRDCPVASRSTTCISRPTAAGPAPTTTP